MREKVEREMGLAMVKLQEEERDKERRNEEGGGVPTTQESGIEK